MITESQMSEILVALGGANILSKKNKLCGPGEDNTIALDVDGAYTRMNGHILYSLILSFETERGER